MNHLENLPDIPRYLTAFAEVGSVVLYAWISERKPSSQWLTQVMLLAVGQFMLQFLAGQLPLFMWIPGMVINILWMALSVHLLTRSRWIATAFITAKAFILSELVASVIWLIYCVTLYQTAFDTHWMITAANLLGYLLLFALIFVVETHREMDEMLGSFTRKDLMITFIMVIITFAISNLGFLLQLTDYQLGNSLAIFMVRTFVDVSGLLLLYMQQYLKLDLYRRREIDNMNYLFKSQYQQYKTYSESTSYINRKAHDLKHQMAVIVSEQDVSKREDYLANLKDSINNLNGKVETGNGVLDTLLTQKNQYCLTHQINFTCIAKGALLEGMNVMDLSSLFGNALDNAIEHVEKIADAQKRLITLKLTNKGNMAVLRVDNYCVDNFDDFEDLPSSSKGDPENHGYGLKSIRYIAHKYGGNMSINLVDNWFTLQVVFPLDEQRAIH